MDSWISSAQKLNNRESESRRKRENQIERRQENTERKNEWISLNKHKRAQTNLDMNRQTYKHKIGQKQCTDKKTQKDIDRSIDSRVCFELSKKIVILTSKSKYWILKLKYK
jgi:hypothetical protein